MLEIPVIENRRVRHAHGSTACPKLNLDAAAPLPLPLGGLTLRVSYFLRFAIDYLLRALLVLAVRFATVSRAIFFAINYEFGAR